MPILDVPARSQRTRFSAPIGSTSHTGAAAVADEIVTNIPENATTGNTAEDHIKDLIARSGHGQASEYATGTNYDVGAEVYWVDSQNKTHFYIRLVAGQDAASSTPNNLTTVWREVVNNLASIPVDGDITASRAIVEMEQSSKAVRASVPLAQKLEAAQTDTEVAAAVEGWITRVVKNSIWKGDWASGTTYAVGDYVLWNNTIYKRKDGQAGSDNAGENPAANTTDWETPTGLELDAAKRLQFISDLADGRGNQAGYVGEWADLDAGAEIEEGNIAKDGSDGFYIATSDHTKQANSPKADPSNYDLLTNWRDTWQDEGYNAGSIVAHSGGIYIAYANVASGDAAPDSPSTSKWTLISTPARYRGEWASIPASGTVWEGDTVYHKITRQGHGLATQYAAETEYSVGDEVYWVDGSNVTRYFERLIEGADASGSNPSQSALSTVWLEILDRAYYICKVTHFRTSFGPDSDPARFDLLSNWIGPFQDGAWYQEGSIVTLGNSFYVAKTDVIPSDPRPDSADNEKWIGNAEGVVTLDHDSPTIEHTEDESKLLSPGPDAVWGGPTSALRGAPGGGVIGSRGGRRSRVHGLPVQDVPEGLAEFYERLSTTTSNGIIHDSIRVKNPVPLIRSMSFSFEVHDVVNNLDTRFSVASATNPRFFLRHISHSTGQQTGLASVSANTPGDTTANNPYRGSAVVDLTSVTFQPLDLLELHWSIDITQQGANSAAVGEAAQAFLDALHSYSLDIELVHETVIPTNLNTYPVQARQIRDVVSYDNTEEAAIEYTAPDAYLDNVTDREYSPLGQVRSSVTAGLIGHKWRIENVAQGRGYLGHPSSNIVVTEANADLSIKYTCDVEFHDQTNDPGNPDRVRMDLMLANPNNPDSIRTNQGAANPDTFLTGDDGAIAYDIIELTGTVSSTISSDSNHTFSYTIPDTLKSTMRTRSGDSGVDDVDQYVRADAEHYIGNTISTRRFRLRVEPRMLMSNTPGQLTLGLFVKGSTTPIWTRDLDTHLSHQNPTQGNKANFGTDIVAYDDSSSATKHGVNYLRDHYWRVYNRGSGAVHYNALEFTCIYTFWRGDDTHGKITLSVPTRTYPNNAKIYVLDRNTTSSTVNRGITFRNQKLTVANVADLAGRRYVLNGTVDEDSLEVEFTPNDPNAQSTWWQIVDGHAVGRQDARRASAHLAIPAHDESFPVIVTLWRERAGALTREKIGEALVHSGAAGEINASALAWTQGEHFIVTCNRYIDDTPFVLTVTAETPDGIPIRQLHTPGLLPVSQITQDTLGRLDHWQRLKILASSPENSKAHIRYLTDWHWAEQNTLHITVETGTTGRWDAVTVHTAMFDELTTMEITRLGNDVGSGDHYIQVQMPNLVLRLAALTDGGVAVYTGENANRRVRAWVE